MRFAERKLLIRTREWSFLRLKVNHVAAACAYGIDWGEPECTIKENLLKV